MRFVRFTVTLALLSALGASVLAHVDSPLLLEGCGSCHVGHGLSGEPMLAASEEEFCYQCHGSEAKRAVMIASGRLAAHAQLADIESEFRKISRHPVSEGSGHSPSERLPDPLRATVDHAECVDCHNPHQPIVGESNEIYKVPGYTLSGQYVEQSSREYEVCFKCHAVRAGTLEASRDVLNDFAGAVVSQHSVSRPSTGIRSVSLAYSAPAMGTLKCSDCHTNDDAGGPRGPHGSRYDYLLSGRYDRDPFAAESPSAFEFCYSCHDRTSVLGNESFSLHREHIVGDAVRNIRGTSCYTCHASHSSADNAYLIDFNPEAVSPDSQTGRLSYSTRRDGSGECYLSCHNHAHSPGRY